MTIPYSTARPMHVETAKTLGFYEIQKPQDKENRILEAQLYISASHRIQIQTAFHLAPEPEQDEIFRLMTGLQAVTIAERFIQPAERKLKLTKMLVMALHEYDVETAQHVLLVHKIAKYIAVFMGKTGAELRNIEISALLHDIGKLGIRKSVLNKPVPLNPTELAHMRRHTDIGASMLAGRSDFKDNIPGILEHHEKLDGVNGYPKGPIGKSISEHGRIIALADVPAALIADRPYRESVPIAKLREYLIEQRGRYFDSDLLDPFLLLLDNPLVVADLYSKKPLDFPKWLRG